MEKRGLPGIQLVVFCGFFFPDKVAITSVLETESQAAPEAGQQTKEGADWEMSVPWGAWRDAPRGNFADQLKKRWQLSTDSLQIKGHIQLIAVAVMNFYMDL